ncbi:MULTISPECIES: reverse transcriptase domain-containing protein [unclassified Desulfovibrio]|uniref:reverse transcriptase domain-containing protein n=1 Tax=unclassified Desulfovibrio TaxID=2593640 RepID=UPI002FD8AA95
MDNIILKKFQSAKNLSDFAEILGFTPQKLSYIIYKHDGGIKNQYTEFEIKKRSGASRRISAPASGLKGVQSKLSDALQDIYKAKKSVHGFVRGRTILTGAIRHSNKRFVFNIDIKDFFPSIHFGRVLGLFCAKPYSLQREVAILVAKIACHNDKLPQGSPCSPVIANMICGHLDYLLSSLAKECGCYYTRYADDLTFSTNKKSFPEEIAIFSKGNWEAGPKLIDLIKTQGFMVNEAKTTMRSKSDRQLVTGIVVNDYPNIQRKLIKQVRAMLHCWRVNGIEAAQEKYKNQFDLENRAEHKKKNISFSQIVRGKIEYIRFIKKYRIELLNDIDKQEKIRTKIPIKKDNQTIHKDQHYKYLQQFEFLSMMEHRMPVIIGEGATDWIHLKKAFFHLKTAGEFSNLNLFFYKHKKYLKGGNDILSNLPEEAKNCQIVFNFPVICIYDSDIANIREAHRKKEDGILSHGNNIFSLVIHKPNHRNNDCISIEQLYSNADLLRKDSSGRRIYLNTEFNPETGFYNEDRTVFYGKRARDGKELKNWKATLKDNEKVLDSDICTIQRGILKNIALSKFDFAINIAQNKPEFRDMDYSEFKSIFKKIEMIIKHHNI